jgi:hypothetical protein
MDKKDFVIFDDIIQNDMTTNPPDICKFMGKFKEMNKNDGCGGKSIFIHAEGNDYMSRLKTPTAKFSLSDGAIMACDKLAESINPPNHQED